MITEVERKQISERALTAAALLGCFLERKFQLTENELEDLHGRLFAILEATRDDRYRCVG